MSESQTDIRRGIWRERFRRHQTGDGAGDSARRDPEHDQQSRAEHQQAIFGQAGEHLRQQHDDSRSQQRSEGAAGTAHVQAAGFALTTVVVRVT